MRSSGDGLQVILSAIRADPSQLPAEPLSTPSMLHRCTALFMTAQVAASTIFKDCTEVDEANAVFGLPASVCASNRQPEQMCFNTLLRTGESKQVNFTVETLLEAYTVCQASMSGYYLEGTGFGKNPAPKCDDSKTLCDGIVDKCNVNTWPIQCPPTPDCQKDKLRGEDCDPQTVNGTEPKLCEAGKWCETVGVRPVKCPKDKYCIVGTGGSAAKPRECSSSDLQVCDEGSKSPKAYLLFVIMLVIDIVVALTYYLVKKREQAKYEDLATSKPSAVVDGAAVELSHVKVESSDNNDDEDGRATEKDALNKIMADAFLRDRGDVKSLRFDFEELSLTLPEKLGGKKILNGVSGVMAPGEVCAIMGPSGAGKTTLLTTLMGKQDVTWEKGGSLLVNGADVPLEKFKKIIGYVPQNDIMLSELTVRDNIEFSARIRLPSWTTEERTQFIDAILKVLQLDHVQGSIVGDESKRGISGGQKKRVNVAIELAAAPVALFLDEPTSGLDSTAALLLCDVLKNAATHASITVGMVIHQPRMEIFSSLDKLLLLAPGGKTVYLGSQADSIPFFETQFNVEFPLTSNPADTLMDCIADNASEMVARWTEIVAENGTFSPEVNVQQDNSESADEENADKESDDDDDEKNEEEERIANVLKSVKTGLKAFSSEVVSTSDDLMSIFSSKSKRGASFPAQIYYCHMRGLRQQYHNAWSFLMECLVASLMGIMLSVLSSDQAWAALWKNQPLGAVNSLNISAGEYSIPFNNLSPTSSSFGISIMSFFSTLLVGLASTASGVGLFGNEQLVYFREAATGHNKLAYFIGRDSSVWLRVAIISLHYAAFFTTETIYLVPGAMMWGLAFNSYFGAYGLSSLISMIFSKTSATLAACTVTLFYAMYGGLVKDQWEFSVFTYSFRGFFWEVTRDFTYIFNVDAIADAQGASNSAIVNVYTGIIVGLCYRVVSFFIMAVVPKIRTYFQKQKCSCGGGIFPCCN